jgi:hypothetical protein
MNCLGALFTRSSAFGTGFFFPPIFTISNICQIFSWASSGTHIFNDAYLFFDLCGILIMCRCIANLQLYKVSDGLLNLLCFVGMIHYVSFHTFSCFDIGFFFCFFFFFLIFLQLFQVLLLVTAIIVDASFSDVLWCVKLRIILAFEVMMLLKLFEFVKSKL